MVKIETNEDLKKYIYGRGAHDLYKLKYTPRGRLVWRSVGLSKLGSYVFTKYSWWQTMEDVDLSLQETKIYCKANKRVKMPSPIFAKIKQMSDRFEKRKQNEPAYV